MNRSKRNNKTTFKIPPPPAPFVNYGKRKAEELESLKQAKLKTSNQSSNLLTTPTTLPNIQQPQLQQLQQLQQSSLVLNNIPKPSITTKAFKVQTLCLFDRLERELYLDTKVAIIEFSISNLSSFSSIHAPNKQPEVCINDQVWQVSSGERICFAKNNYHQSIFTHIDKLKIIQTIISTYIANTLLQERIKELESQLRYIKSTLNSTRINLSKTKHTPRKE